MAALTLGGAFGCFKLPGGALGLGAKLPAHGCQAEAHCVLLSIKPAASADATNVERHAKQACEVDCMEIGWDISSMSVDRRLAQAAVAALVTQLKCPPENVFTTAPPDW